MILLQMLDIEREAKFLETVILSKASTLDRSSSGEIKAYNDLLSQYRTIMFNLKPEAGVKSSKESKITEDDLLRFIGKRSKTVTLKGQSKGRFDKELDSVPIKDITK